jgi:hypothetical protein
MENGFDFKKVRKSLLMAVKCRRSFGLSSEARASC